MVNANEARRQVVVVDPHNPNGEEADGIGRVRRPQTAELVPELSVLGFWHFDLEDQQGDGDGQHPVTERAEPVRGQFLVFSFCRLHRILLGSQGRAAGAQASVGLEL